MYQKILDEALLELKETDFKDLFPTDAQASYVKDVSLKLILRYLFLITTSQTSPNVLTSIKSWILLRQRKT